MLGSVSVPERPGRRLTRRAQAGTAACPLSALAPIRRARCAGVARSARAFVCALVAAVVALVSARSAQAQQITDGRYIIGRGETLSEIAERMHVTTRVLAEHNHLQPPYALRTGRGLRVPAEVPDDVYRQLGGDVRTRAGRGAPTTNAAPTQRPEVRTTVRSVNTRVAASAGRTPTGGGRWGRPASRGYVRLVRENTGAMMDIHMRRITPGVQSRMRAFLRFADGRSHAINPRLLRQLAIVSDHFGGRRLHVISGFRPFRRGQWTPHSNHNIGRAIDFRVEGVPNRVLRDFCRSLPQTGCGFYPRSVFVHMDVREESATWVDWSRPGQRPMYGREDRPPEANSSAAAARRSGEDEGVDDVAQDNTRVREATTVEERDDDERARREGSDTPATGGATGAGTTTGTTATTPGSTSTTSATGTTGAASAARP